MVAPLSCLLLLGEVFLMLSLGLILCTVVKFCDDRASNNEEVQMKPEVRFLNDG